MRGQAVEVDVGRVAWEVSTGVFMVGTMRGPRALGSPRAVILEVMRMDGDARPDNMRTGSRAYPPLVYSCLPHTS